MEQPAKVSLGEIFSAFLMIGATGFGGGMAIISLIERVCVEQKRWVSRDVFMHGIAFSQILGPFSLNASTFVGYQLRGAMGGMVAAVAFIMPSFFLISLFSWLYFRYHELPQLQSALSGTNPVIIGLILVAAYGMGRARLKSLRGWLMALAAFAAAGLFEVSSSLVLLLAALWSLADCWWRRRHA
jgi:chromate transporter